MKKSRKIIALLMAAIMVMSMLAGCSSDGDAPATDGGDDAAPRTDLNLAVTASPGTLDPHFYSASDDFLIFTQIYETLFYPAYTEGADGNPVMSYQPRLATDDYTVNAEATVWTVNIRDDVKFTNGEPLTADDVVFSIERAMTSPIMAFFLGTISGVKEVSDYTVEFTLAAPSASFLLNLSMVQIMNREFTEAAGESIATTTCGTGAYILEEITEGQRTVLVANDEYYMGAPSIKTVTYRVFPDQTTMLTAFEAGELDGINVSANDWDYVVDSGEYTTYSVPSSRINYLAMNVEKTPFDNVKVRQAVNYAMDRETINQIATGGTYTEAYTFVAPGIVRGAVLPDNIYEYDVEKAKALLAEAGYPDGFTIDEPMITMVGLPNDIAVAVQQMLAAIGISVEIEIQERNTVLANSSGGNFTLQSSGITLPDEFYYFGLPLATSAINSLNSSRYSNPELDELFAKISAETDDEARYALQAQATNIINDEAIFAPLLNYTYLIAMNKDLNYDGIFMGKFDDRIYSFSWE